MSEPRKKDLRYVGKVQEKQMPQGWTAKQIHMDNHNAENKDGTPNTFYKGILVWCDAVTGKNYKVTQMTMTVPQNGMKQADLDRGYTCLITLDLESGYQVTVLG